MSFQSYKVLPVSSYNDCQDATFTVYDINDLIVVKINTDFISDIQENKFLTIKVHGDMIDDFICFFIIPKIVLFEKIISLDLHRKFISKIWKDSEVDQYGDFEISYEFNNVFVNVITMNNSNVYNLLLWKEA